MCLHYGNTGCGVSISGIQNQIDFCLKVKCFKGLYNTPIIIPGDIEKNEMDKSLVTW